MASLCGRISNDLFLYQTDSPRPAKTVVAKVLYVTIVPIAIVEAALSLVVRILAALIPFNTNCITKWNKASLQAFTPLIQRIFCYQTKTVLKKEEPQQVVEPVLSPKKEHPPKVELTPLLPPQNRLEREIIPTPKKENPILDSPPIVELCCPPPKSKEVEDLEKTLLYSRYELGDLRDKAPDLSELYCTLLPPPFGEDLLDLKNHLCIFAAEKTKQNKWPGNHAKEIDRFLDDHYVSPDWCLKVKKILWFLVSIYKTQPVGEDKDNLRKLITNAIRGDRDSRSVAIEDLYYNHVERIKLEKLKDEEKILRYQIKRTLRRLRDSLIVQSHGNLTNKGAAAINYCRKNMNETLFGLPPAPLCTSNGKNEEMIRGIIDPKIFHKFCVQWNAETLISQFEHWIYQDDGKHYVYTPKIFQNWLKRNGKWKDAFEDAGKTRYKPKLIVEYLVAHNIIQEKKGL